MCISETCFRLALCKLYHMKADNNMSFQLIAFEASSLTFITEKQINKQTNAAWPYFWSFFKIFYASGPCIYHATSIWRSLHGANLKYVSEMHIFQNGTPPGHTMPIWNMFQDGTCFRTARNTCIHILVVNDKWHHRGLDGPMEEKKTKGNDHRGGGGRSLTWKGCTGARGWPTGIPSCRSLPGPVAAWFQFFTPPLWAKIINFDSCVRNLSKI